MADSNFRILATNKNFSLLLHDTGGTDDDGNPIYSLGAHVDGLDAADIEIGGVEIKDGATDTRAKVGASTALAESDNALAAHDPSVGKSTDAAVVTDANGTVIGFLRGLVKMLADVWDSTNHFLKAGLQAGENHVGAVGGHTARITDSFSRPVDTNAYASGDLVANNTVANSVAPLTFAIGRSALGKGGMVRRCRLRKTGTSITNAQFRLHLYSASPVQTGAGGAGTGDNAAWLTDKADNYVGAIDITVDKAFTDGAAGNGVPLVGSEINFTADTYYGLLEARGAYTPASGETFNVLLEILQN